jgi:predicted ATPase
MPPGISVRDLGLHRLRDLTRPGHIYQVEAEDLPVEFPPLPTVDYRPNNLPTQATAFIGREQVLAQVADLLHNNHLLSLIGPGGTGKTRLALQAAADSLDDFDDGVFFVDLTPVSSPTLVDQTIAATLGVGVGSRQDPTDALKKHLQYKQILLLLDNFEHVLDAANLVGELLGSVPNLKFIVTSREPLHIYGEQEYFVPPLELPEAADSLTLEQLTRIEAIHLFIDRARAVAFDFSLSRESAPVVAEICRRLDGLPLAIELAAARIKILPPAALLDRLEQSLGLLTGGPRDSPGRHQTLRNAITWSHDLLTEEEQALFRQLAVFRGGASLEAAEAVCSLPGPVLLLDALYSLVDKNMLRQGEGTTGEPRFTMLRTIQEFAWERLRDSGDELKVRRRHMKYLLACAKKVYRHLSAGEEMSYWHHWAGDEQDNIRSTLTWSLGSDYAQPVDAEHGAFLIGRMFYFFYSRGFLDEGRRWFRLAIVHLPDPSPARARVLVGAGTMAWQQGDYAEAQPDLEEAVTIFRELGEKSELAQATHWLGHNTFDQKRYWNARQQFSESLALYRELGDEEYAVILSKDVGLVAYHEGDYLAARLRFEEVLAFYRHRDITTSVADALVHLGDLARLDGDLDLASGQYQEARSLYQEREARLGLAGSLHKLGQVAILQGDYEQARSLLKNSLAMQQEAGNKQGIAECLASFAALAGASGDFSRAVQLYGATAAYLEKLGAPLAPADRVDLEKTQAAARNQLDYARFDRLWAEGQALTLQEALDLAEG